MSFDKKTCRLNGFVVANVLLLFCVYLFQYSFWSDKWEMEFEVNGIRNSFIGKAILNGSNDVRYFFQYCYKIINILDVLWIVWSKFTLTLVLHRNFQFILTKSYKLNIKELLRLEKLFASNFEPSVTQHIEIAFHSMSPCT